MIDKISKEEIKKVIDEYEKENSASKTDDFLKLDDDADFSKDAKPVERNDNYNNKSANEIKDELFSKKAPKVSSSEFKQFEEEDRPMLHSWYEKACRFAGSIVKISPSKNQKIELKDALDTCNFNITPEDTFSFAIIWPLIYMVAGLLFTILLLKADMFFLTVFLLTGIGMMIPITKLPFMFANITRLKTSKEIVLCVFYMVTYMRQNSNLEKAVEFAAQHLTGPLAAELKKVLWDVESEKYPTIKLSLDTYLEKWRKTNGEFLETINLIESSLYEPREENRIALLDKALDVILTETYEKMLHYSHEIQSPISTLHMLGVILPILGLVILPLVVAFMENVYWYNIAVLYNVILPVIVFFVGKNILSTRPGGHGSLDLSDDNPLVRAQKNKKYTFLKMKPLFIALLIGITLCLIGISPIIFHYTLPDRPNIGRDILLFYDKYEPGSGIKFLDYRESKTAEEDGTKTVKGPYGLIATLMSLFIILGLGLGIGTYYILKTKDLVELREHTRKLEDEFGSAIFQLGNRLGDGIPLEMSFSKVVDVMRDSEPGKFFSIIDQNIRRLGMSVEQAIFDSKEGALVYFPSNLIRSTMQVLNESIKKGPLIAARAMSNVARYVKEMHAVEERLRDLLAEVISSMNSLIKFLAPVISGIVVGITSMITSIIGQLHSSLSSLESTESAGAFNGLVQMFGDGIPSYYFQIVVGIYIVQIVYIISQTINGVSNGDDKLGEENLVGNYLVKSTLIYVIITAIVMIIFNIVSITILNKTLTTDVGM